MKRKKCRAFKIFENGLLINLPVPKSMEADGGLRLILKHLELRSSFGRRRQKLKRQWRNGKKNAFPSPSAIFRYLSLFHNVSQEKLREPNTAFIPEPNEHLLGLAGINKAMLEFLQLNNPQEIATIDMDATVVASYKEEALYSYKKIKSYQPLSAWWWIMLISLNLTSIMKSIVLGKVWKKRRMKSIRFSIINIGGRVIKKGKELVIRLSIFSCGSLPIPRFLRFFLMIFY